MVPSHFSQCNKEVLLLNLDTASFGSLIVDSNLCMGWRATADCRMCVRSCFPACANMKQKNQEEQYLKLPFFYQESLTLIFFFNFSEIIECKILEMGF